MNENVIFVIPVTSVNSVRSAILVNPGDLVSLILRANRVSREVETPGTGTLRSQSPFFLT